LEQHSHVPSLFALKYSSSISFAIYLGAKHMAIYLKELCEAAALNVATVKILDVAAGTGLVGVELAKLGFKNIVALDYSQEMLDLAEEKGKSRKGEDLSEFVFSIQAAIKTSSVPHLVTQFQMV
jgi:ubiquinone/menaquinone biosynthesis C-methylase UbiE